MTFDLSSLTVTDSDESLSRKPGAGRPSIDNPFGPIVLASWDAAKDHGGTMVGTTKVLTVVNDAERGKNGEPVNVTTIKGLIRRAGEANGLGVRIVSEEIDKKGNHAKPGNGVSTTIKFAAKVKTIRARLSADAIVENGEAVAY